MKEPSNAMPEPASAAALKIVSALAAPLIGGAKREWARRNAGGASLDLISLDPQIDEALDVLALGPDRFDKALINSIKAQISGRPPIFDHPPIGVWLKNPTARDAIKRAVMGSIADRDVDTDLAAAVAAYAPYEENARAEVAPALEYAVAFAILSIGRDVGVGDRLVLAAVKQTQAMVEEVSNVVKGDAAGTHTAYPRELVDGHVVETLETLRQWRLLLPAGIAGDAARLAGRLKAGGDLSSASSQNRARGLALCARWLSRTAAESDVSELIAVSEELLITPELAIAKAFQISQQGDWSAALAALKPVNTPERRSAALIIYGHHHDAASALEWARTAGIRWEDLDPDGRFFMLQYMVGADLWEDALDLVHRLEPQDLAFTPALNISAAVISAASQVPKDLRQVMAGGGVQVDPAGFPIADTPSALVERRAAERYYRAAASAARSAGNPAAVRVFETTALWLRLRDPDGREEGRREVAAALDDPERAIAVLPLALGFDLPVNLDEVERKLAAVEAIDPAGDVDIAFARFALIDQQKSLDDRLSYFQRHRSVIDRHLAFEGVLDFEVKLLVQAGRIESARERIAEAGDRLIPGMTAKLEGIVRAGPEGQSLANLEQAYDETPTLPNLSRLVDALIRQGFSERLFELWRRLVSTTQVQLDAETLVRFLIGSGRWSEIDAVLEDVGDLIDGSLPLRSAKAWSLYRAGRFVEARQMLADLRAARDDADDRALHVNLIIASGRWPELSAFVETEWTARDQRTAQELLGVAELAARLGAQRLPGFLKLAAQLDPNDPHVLIACYSLAVRSGNEDLAHSQHWLEDAIRTSGDDGPIQSASLETLIEGMPDWNARVDDIWTKLKTGEIPMAVAALPLRRSPLDLQLVSMIANREERDPRRRSAVPAFSGARDRPDLTAASFGLDLTALVTLGVLDVLDRLVDQGGVVIGHGVIRTLFEDRQKLAFHQPSRIQNAHALVRSLGTGKLHTFSASSEPDPSMIGLVGQGLAEMLAHARLAVKPDQARRYVIRSNPVQKIGSFSGEAADLGTYHDVLRGCGAVIDKLAEAGQLTIEESGRAKAFLEHQQERPWGEAEEIDDGADLFLDDLSVDYLRSMGVLDRLHAAGLKAFVSRREVDEANAFLALEARAGDIERVIDRIRECLSTGIESGKVTVGPEASNAEHPPIGETLVDLSRRADVLVCDDRFINQHRMFADLERQTPVWTSLDVLDRLHADGLIDDAERATHRTDLRRGGLIVFPCDPLELATQVRLAPVKDGRLVETGDLRAFRENVALSQMGGWLRLPQEIGWVMGQSSVLLDLIGEQWSETIEDDASRARSDWLLDQSDVRNWVGAIVDHDGADMAAYGRVWQLVKLMLAPFVSKQAEVNQRYAAWLENKVAAVQQTEPAIYDWILKSLRQLVIGYHNEALKDD